MKKLFISCPMKGRTKGAIENSMKTMHKVAELMFDEELEVIDSYIKEDAPEGANAGVWYLAKSIEKLADADYFIGVEDGWNQHSGCEIERVTASFYGIPGGTVSVSDFPCFYDI